MEAFSKFRGITRWCCKSTCAGFFNITNCSFNVEVKNILIIKNEY